MRFHEDFLWLSSSAIWFLFVMIWWCEKKKDSFSNHNELRYERRLYRLIAILPFFINVIVLLLKVGLLFGFIQ